MLQYYRLGKLLVATIFTKWPSVCVEQMKRVLIFSSKRTSPDSIVVGIPPNAAHLETLMG